MLMRLVFVILALSVCTVSAQNSITFNALEAQTSAPITLDSVFIVHDGTQGDTTLIGVTSFDLGALSDVPSLPARATMIELGVPAPTVFDEHTVFELRSGARERLDLRVCAVDGRIVAAWHGTAEPGTFRFAFDGAGLPAGMYLIAASTPSHTAVRKVLKSAGGGPAPAQLRLLSSQPLTGEALGRATAERWTFIGYARGYQPDTLAGVEAQGGTQYSFLMTPVPAGMKLSTGRMHPAGSWQVAPQGGSILVNTPGSPAHGISITVPDGAHGETRQYDLSTADITSHQLGGDVRILTPLIQVRNGGGYAGELITIRIPAAIPQDEFAIAFLYNEKTGEIEGLPLLEEDATGLTVATRHFGTSSVAGSGFRKTAVDGWTSAVGNMFIASVKKSFLSGKSVISTGYGVGQDDWEFPNYGSYIAPKGHCAGQTVTSMWYYYEKKLRGAPRLHHRYDHGDADTLWMDNPRGYKLSSVIQEDMRWDGWLYNNLKELADSSRHELGWNALNMAMLLTGEPQLLAIYSTRGGHAIIAYSINVTDGTIAVADPNFPGKEREVVFRAPHFQPYSSKQNANEPDPQAYTRISYMAKTSVIDWDRITSRWAEFENHTIGTVEPNRFPQVSYVTATGEELIDSLAVSTDTLALISGNLTGMPRSDLRMACFDQNGVKVSLPSWIIPIASGTNLYGLYSEGSIAAESYFVDFKWLHITNRVPTITSITPSKAKPGDTIVIAGSGFGDDKSIGAVSLAGANVPGIMSWTETEIRVTVPASAKSGSVVVRRQTSVSNPKALTVDVPRAITRIEPTHGYSRDTVRIHGTRLRSAMFVYFNGIYSPTIGAPGPADWSDTLIWAVVPGDCVSGTVELAFSGEPRLAAPEPFVMDPFQVSSVSPLTGPKGTLVTIAGTHLDFTQDATVTVGGVAATANWTSGSIYFTADQSGQIVIQSCGRRWDGPFFVMTP